MHDRVLRLGSWIVLVIGLGCVAGAIAIGQGSFRLLLYGARAEAEVVEIRRTADMYAPVLRFRTNAGEMREVEDLGTGAPDFAVGDTVAIYYWPDRPDTFRLGTFGRLWGSTLFLAGFGSVWLLFAGAMMALLRGASVAAAGEAVFGGIAALSLAVFVLAGWQALTLYRAGAVAEGIVTGFSESKHVSEDEDRRRIVTTMYAPIVRFVAAGGRAIEFHGRAAGAPRFAVGAKVAVLYDPALPGGASIFRFVDLWLPCVVAGGIFILFGGAVWASRHYRLRDVRPPR